MTDETTQAEPETPNEGEAQVTLADTASTDDVTLGGDTTETATDSESGADTSPEADTSETDQRIEGAPETYDFTDAEGAKLEDSGVVTTFGEVAKEANLTQDQAQTMLSKLTESLQKDQVSRTEALTQEWAASAREDKEFGGDKLSENMATAKVAYSKFASPELRELMKATGLETHPEVIRMFYRAGRALSDDSFVGEGSSTSSGPDFTKGSVFDNADAAAKVLFPTMSKD